MIVRNQFKIVIDYFKIISKYSNIVSIDWSSPIDMILLGVCFISAACLV